MITTKLIKELCDLFSEFICKSIDHCITAGILQETSRKLKFVHFIKMMEQQRNHTIDQLVFSLIFQKYKERCLYSQLYDYFHKNIFSKNQCGFRKGFNTQPFNTALLVMIAKMKNARDQKKFCAAILTDLSKAFH